LNQSDSKRRVIGFDATSARRKRRKRYRATVVDKSGSVSCKGGINNLVMLEAEHVGSNSFLFIPSLS